MRTIRCFTRTLAPQVLQAVAPLRPSERPWHEGLTTEEILAEMRRMVALVPDLPFDPDKAVVLMPCEAANLNLHGGVHAVDWPRFVSSRLSR